jgi:hypothetical protein
LLEAEPEGAPEYEPAFEPWVLLPELGEKEVHFETRILLPLEP